MAFSITLNMTKLANVPWFADVDPTSANDDQNFVRASAGFVSSDTVLLNNTEQTVLTIFDTKANYTTMMNNRRQTSAFQVRSNYYAENYETVNTTYAQT